MKNSTSWTSIGVLVSNYSKYSHSNSVTTKGVQNIGCSCEVQDLGRWSRMNNIGNLAP